MILANKTALITGASRGIGRAIAIEFARQGADVALLGRDTPALEETAGECARARVGARADIFTADVTDAAAIQGVVSEVVSRFGRLDCAVANAGQSIDALLLRLKPETIDRMLDVNLKSAFHLCAAVAKPMMKQRSGAIVLMTSIVGLSGNAGQSAYAASKAGLIGPEQIAREGVGFEEYKSQRRRAGPHRNRHDRRGCPTQLGNFWSNKPLSAEPGSRRTSAAWSRFSAPTPPATSPGKRSWSMAAS